jgi:hypothetical protein
MYDHDPHELSELLELRLKELLHGLRLRGVDGAEIDMMLLPLGPCNAKSWLSLMFSFRIFFSYSPSSTLLYFTFEYDRLNKADLSLSSFWNSLTFRCSNRL